MVMILSSVSFLVLLSIQFAVFVRGQYNAGYPNVGYDYLRQGYYNHYQCTLQCYKDIFELTYIKGNLCQGSVELNTNNWLDVPFELIVKSIECITVNCRFTIYDSFCGASNGQFGRPSSWSRSYGASYGYNQNSQSQANAESSSSSLNGNNDNDSVSKSTSSAKSDSSKLDSYFPNGGRTSYTSKSKSVSNSGFRENDFTSRRVSSSANSASRTGGSNSGSSASSSSNSASGSNDYYYYYYYDYGDDDYVGKEEGYNEEVTPETSTSTETSTPTDSTQTETPTPTECTPTTTEIPTPTDSTPTIETETPTPTDSTPTDSAPTVETSTPTDSTSTTTTTQIPTESTPTDTTPSLSPNSDNGYYYYYYDNVDSSSYSKNESESVANGKGSSSDSKYFAYSKSGNPMNKNNPNITKEFIEKIDQPNAAYNTYKYDNYAPVNQNNAPFAKSESVSRSEANRNTNGYYANKRQTFFQPSTINQNQLQTVRNSGEYGRFQNAYTQRQSGQYGYNSPNPIFHPNPYYNNPFGYQTYKWSDINSPSNNPQVIYQTPNVVQYPNYNPYGLYSFRQRGPGNVQSSTSNNPQVFYQTPNVAQYPNYDTYRLSSFSQQGPGSVQSSTQTGQFPRWNQGQGYPEIL